MFINEAVEAINQGLAARGLPPRVTDRLIRYYATQGIVNLPRRTGRQAIYTGRHVAEIIATAALSERGMKLSVIRAATGGKDEAALYALADEAMKPLAAPVVSSVDEARQAVKGAMEALRVAMEALAKAEASLDATGA